MQSAIRLIPLDSARRQHAHDFHQLVIGVEGNAECEIERLGGVIAPLTGCIVPAGHLHYYAGLDQNRQLILDLPENAPPLSGPHHGLRHLFDAPRFFTLDTALTHYLDFLLQELETSPSQGKEACSWQDELMTATLLSRLLARQGSNRRIPPARLDIDALDHYIHDRLSHPLGVADLARHVCLSEAHFSTCFREQTGISPYQYILHRRLQKVSEYLTNTTLPLYEIAEHTGFTHQSALSHAFRRVYGHPPSKLRRKRGEENAAP